MGNIDWLRMLPLAVMGAVATGFFWLFPELIPMTWAALLFVGVMKLLIDKT